MTVWLFELRRLDGSIHRFAENQVVRDDANRDWAKLALADFAVPGASGTTRTSAQLFLEVIDRGKAFRRLLLPRTNDDRVIYYKVEPPGNLKPKRVAEARIVMVKDPDPLTTVVTLEDLLHAVESDNVHQALPEFADKDDDFLKYAEEARNSLWVGIGRHAV